MSFFFLIAEEIMHASSLHILTHCGCARHSQTLTDGALTSQIGFQRSYPCSGPIVLALTAGKFGVHRDVQGVLRFKDKRKLLLNERNLDVYLNHQDKELVICVIVLLSLGLVSHASVSM